MKKKILWGILGAVVAVIVILGAIWGVRIYQRELDPNWQLAKKLYNVESALKEIDESWKLESLTQVTPYTYKNPEGDTITYYCCTTTYVGDDPVEYVGLDKTALSQVVDVDALEKSRNCEVNDLEAVLGEMEGKTYLCWTISPKYSCVIEYEPDAMNEADIFRMAESVGEQ